jgi:DnaJ family protein A protein 2
MPHTELYDCLGISNNANAKEIKKCFRKLALKWHPDKWTGKSERERKIATNKFKELSEAYEILSDPEKRQTYDRFGLDAVRGNGHGGGMTPDMFSEMFGDMGGFPFMGSMGGRQKRKKELKLPNLIHIIHLNLAEIYKGKTCDFEVNRYILRDVKKQPTKTDMICSECKGMGMVVKTRHVGPNMMTQTQHECTVCHGKCVQYPNRFFREEKKKYSRSIPRGVINGEKIIIDNIGHDIPKCFSDQYPCKDRTDMELVITEDRSYTIDGFTYLRGVNNSPFNIKLDMQLEGYEAICGTVKNIKFLNGELLSIKIPPGIIFSQGEVAIVIPKMGMPFYKQRNIYGELFVLCTVNKCNIDRKQASEIWKTLTGNDMKDSITSVLKNTQKQYIEAISLADYKKSNDYKNTVNNNETFERNMRGNNDDDDEQEHGHRQGVPGCAQQ